MALSVESRRLSTQGICGPVLYYSCGTIRYCPRTVVHPANIHSTVLFILAIESHVRRYTESVPSPKKENNEEKN